MKLTDLNLGEQLKLTDREIRRRLELFALTQQDIDELVGMKPVVAANINELVESFYAGQVAVEEIARRIGDSETLARLKNHMARYILTMFDGEYGMEYVLSRLRIGLVHKRIGVPPKLYVPSFRNLFTRLREVILGNNSDCGACRHRTDALEKIMFFDLELVFDTYIYSLLEELERGKKELEEYAESLEETVAKRTEQLARLASRDGLTGLLNQRSFYEELRREIARTLRTDGELALIYLDLDGFKAVNDTKGHRRGDEILIAVAEVIRRVVRAEDIPARYGGDEFCIILPHSSSAKAQEAAQRLIEAFDQEEGLKGAGVTLSIGIAAGGNAELRDADLLVKKADAAMYRSKKIPGHAITLAGDLPAAD
ncbi:MAG: GGDEF domain-containing protein [Desulfobulbaceae bacterium]|nr:GGDEF domain-containing protein [Desulfobulbaceae bacterium]